MKPSTKTPAKCAFIVPAAGIGKRFGSDKPKQYHPLAGLTVLEQTLGCLNELSLPIVVAVAPEDPYFDKLNPSVDDLHRVEGGKERFDSVANALDYIVEQDLAQWVLVHDAVRPCIWPEDIEKLMKACLSQDQGGLLVAPSVDTLKFTENGLVTETLDRQHIQRALTPQMFKAVDLQKAIANARQSQQVFTDEASCMEHTGYKPLTVVCDSANLKITTSQDLTMAEAILKEDVYA